MPPTHLLIRFCFRVTLPCVLLLVFVVLLVHGQSSSGSDVGALLMPPTGCSAPCFLGIKLGQATLTSGLDQLRASRWIQSISPVSSEPNSPAPTGLYDVEFVPTVAPVRTAQVRFMTEADTGIIESILLMHTGIPLSDIVLAFGQPTPLLLDDRLHLGLVTYVAFYPQYQMYVQVVLPVCPSGGDPFWNEQHNVLIGVESAQQYAQQRSYYPADAPDAGGRWLQQIHDLKQTDCA